jgi:hypothetical protein
VGPAITSTATNFNWLLDVTTGARPDLGAVTGHQYPLDACAPPGSPTHPTISRVLSDVASVGLAQSVDAAVRLAHHANLRFYLDEMNSVTCGGLAGVSDTFATALWAPDALFNLLRTGLDGVNLHIRPDRINGPFTVTPEGLNARPLLYGLIMFARTLEPGGQLINLGQQGAPSPHLKTWAVRSHAGLHVLFINKGGQSTTVALRAPARGAATLVRLLAPSPVATDGVTLGGQTLGPNGSWLGHTVSQAIPHANAGYLVTVPGYSAVLLSSPG